MEIAYLFVFGWALFPLTRVISQRSGEISSIENRCYLQEIACSCLTANDRFLNKLNITRLLIVITFNLSSFRPRKSPFAQQADKDFRVEESPKIGRFLHSIIFFSIAFRKNYSGRMTACLFRHSN